jgi:hypothetical protein
MSFVGEDVGADQLRQRRQHHLGVAGGVVEVGQPVDQRHRPGQRAQGDGHVGTVMAARSWRAPAG